MMQANAKAMGKKSLQIVILALVVAAAIPVTAVQAQEEQTKLGDVIGEYGFNWMIGRWEASTDEGQKITIQYRWALDKNVVLVNFQMGEYAMQGMIFFKPMEEEVVQISADNRGGHSKVAWQPEGDKAVAKYEFTSAAGEVRKMAITHTKVDRKTFQAEMFAIDEFGDLAEKPWGTLEYKRVRRSPTKKATGKMGTAKAKNDLAGKWKGEFVNEWQEKLEFAVVIAKNDKGGYQIKVQESFDDWAETIVVLDAKREESGEYTFKGDSDDWSGSGRGVIRKNQFKGAYKGTESGTFTMSRIPQP